ncbi:MAG: RNA polymerase sigma-54 factor, partial [Bacteroidales bacterium]|nr:RNA polymerase sigma-54 factor [Bacteroidales bacterium]
VNGSGEEVSTREIKKILKDSVDNEDKSQPLTDEELVDLLTKKGYQISRRTIAKYRSQLDIPIARMRREI